MDFDFIDKLYEMYGIPAGATTNWMMNCCLRKYNASGYDTETIYRKTIGEDFVIEVSNHRMCSSSRDRQPFFTSVSFKKKQEDSDYFSPYCIFYPYVTKFYTKLLEEIGFALNILIDRSRSKEGMVDLKRIEQKECALLSLFINGTIDNDAVKKIMCDLAPKTNCKHKVKITRHRPTFLPDIISDLDIEHAKNCKYTNSTHFEFRELIK